MSTIFSRWFQRKFSNPQAVVLGMLLLFGFAAILLLSDILNPLFVAIVLAYLLEWVVSSIEQKSMSRLWSVVIVFLSFVALLLTTVFIFIPLIWKQIVALGNDLPGMLKQGQERLLQLPEQYPDFISQNQIEDVTRAITAELGTMGQAILSASIDSLLSVVVIAIYLILVPLLIFFLLKDKSIILEWVSSWLPKERTMANQVWSEVNIQIGNYIRGKVAEILIVGIATYIVFAFMGLNYALLLSVLVGFSVLIPYIGAALVTIPVALIGYFQWGFSAEFGYLIIAYGIIQALDGNVLVPILFSEAVNLHPVAIISAVLLFGGIWGFWGVFFAIPLATLVKAVLNAWQEVPHDDADQSISEA
ncbi:MAG: AI-2E family transporter [Gammaproteobacteria bacterium]|nr:AI-2E family transporter [Gammaproteobacteria bacterium]NNJ72577.1 AI-2E family transporter [Enterobacterales bacterium]